MDVGIPVEERRWRELMRHGIAGGLLAGGALGLVQFLTSAAQREGALTPFRLAASLVLGPQALQPEASATLLIGTGVALHFFLAALFGVVFVTLLALSYQLSARTGILLGYGLLFGFLLWEVNFLAILPGLYQELTPYFKAGSQILGGIVAYALVYGPGLALYVARTRPGVLSDWRD